MASPIIPLPPPFQIGSRTAQLGMKGPFLAVSHSGDKEKVPAQSGGVFPHPGHIGLHLTLEDSFPQKYRAPAPRIPPTASPTTDCAEGWAGWDP